MSDGEDLRFLEMAARLALRGHGGAEPNPMVGCVIVNAARRVVGWGYHRQCGGPHAEIVALHRAGELARAATLYCTLEPCNHTGKTGPCTDAITQAGIERVVIARRDPNPVAAGGLEKLRAAGIAVEVNDQCEAAIAVSDPFAQRVRSGLPWITVKWAQTIDGKIATRPPHNESQWISNEASRKMVHRQRGRVDVILTGIGTVLKDDPMLTAREVRVRRVARRVVIDPMLDIPIDAKLVATAHQFPTVILTDTASLDRQKQKTAKLQDCGVEIIGSPCIDGELSLSHALRELANRFNATHVMVEAGPGLMARLFQQQLANEAWVFIAPLLLGDQAAASVSGMTVNHLADATNLKLMSVQRRGGDMSLRYRVR